MEMPHTIKNSFGLVCNATNYMLITDSSELASALSESVKNKIPIIPIGEASNVILPSQWQCLCVSIGMDEIEITEEQDAVFLRVGAGRKWHDLVTYCVEKGFYGLENLALIPGKVGAAPIQNIGAYGTEISEFIRSVELVEIETGSSYKVDVTHCGLNYRTSKFKHEWKDKFIITHINLKLHKQPKVNVNYASLQEWLNENNNGVISLQDVSPQDVFNAVVSLRTKILPDPQVNGNVGSFFHNPVIDEKHFSDIKSKLKDIKGYKLDQGYESGKVRVAAASLLEALGFRGHKNNGVAMSPQHSLCMINLGGAHQEDVLALAEEIQQKVKEETSVELNLEPRIYR